MSTDSRWKLGREKNRREGGGEGGRGRTPHVMSERKEGMREKARAQRGMNERMVDEDLLLLVSAGAHPVIEFQIYDFNRD